MVADTHDELPESKVKFPAFRRYEKDMKDREGNTILVDKKSSMNHLHASNLVKKEYNKLWSKADECPLYRQKIEQQEDDEGNKIPYKRSKATKKLITTRGNRALSGHTLKTLASGAAATSRATSEPKEWPMMTGGSPPIFSRTKSDACSRHSSMPYSTSAGCALAPSPSRSSAKTR